MQHSGGTRTQFKTGKLSQAVRSPTHSNFPSPRHSFAAKRGARKSAHVSTCGCAIFLVLLSCSLPPSMSACFARTRVRPCLCASAALSEVNNRQKSCNTSGGQQAAAFKVFKAEVLDKLCRSRSRTVSLHCPALPAATAQVSRHAPRSTPRLTGCAECSRRGRRRRPGRGHAAEADRPRRRLPRPAALPRRAARQLQRLRRGDLSRLLLALPPVCGPALFPGTSAPMFCL